MKDIKLVICDLDDTLIVKHTKLTDEAKKAIIALQDRGIYFGVASGRLLSQLYMNLNEWGITAQIVVGMNGSCLYDGIHDKEHNYYVLNADMIKTTLDLMRQFNANPIIYRGDTIYCARFDEMVQLSATCAKMKAEARSDESFFYEETTPKIMFRVNEDQMKDVEAYLAENCPADLAYFKTQPTLMEFCDARVSKAYGIEKFCSFNDMSMDQVMAFGDTSNDNSMLEACGIGVCLKNGSDDTKAIADYITEKTCEENGFAHFVNQYFNL